MRYLAALVFVLALIPVLPHSAAAEVTWQWNFDGHCVGIPDWDGCGFVDAEHVQAALGHHAGRKKKEFVGFQAYRLWTDHVICTDGEPGTHRYQEFMSIVSEPTYAKGKKISGWALLGTGGAWGQGEFDVEGDCIRRGVEDQFYVAAVLQTFIYTFLYQDHPECLGCYPEWFIVTSPVSQLAEIIEEFDYQ